MFGISISISKLVLFLVLLTRISSMFLAAPFFNYKVIPVRVRVSLALLCAILVYMVGVPTVPFQPESASSMLFLLAGEVLVGVLIGFVSGLIFTAVQMAGQLMGYQIGFVIAKTFDPLSDAHITVLSTFHGLVALLIFISLNFHHYLYAVVVESYRIVPVAPLTGGNTTVLFLVECVMRLFPLSVKLAAIPFFLLFTVDFVIGIIGKAVPQIPVLIVGFPVKIGAGLIAVGLGMQGFYTVLRGEFLELGPLLVKLLKMF